MHLPAGGCWRVQVDGGAWLLLFPMATVQLCMEADKWAQAAYTDRTFCMAPCLDQVLLIIAPAS